MESYTIIEEGAVFSRAQRDPGREALDAIRERLATACQQLPATDVLATRLAAKAESVLAVFNDMLEQRRTMELVEQSIDEQLKRATSRYDELPESVPGGSMALDRVRQFILSEKQNLMRELRAARLQHVKEIARLRERLIEAFANYCSIVRLLPAEATRLPLTLVELENCIPRTLKGDAVVILSTPELRPASEVRLP